MPLDTYPAGALSGAADAETMPEDQGTEAAAPVAEEDAGPIVIGGVEVQPKNGHHAKLLRWSDPKLSPNIAVDILNQPDGEGVLNALGQRVIREYEIDESSRSAWRDRSKSAMDLAMQVVKAKETPWPKASNVVYPLMTMASQQFAARAYPAIVPGPDVVKGTIVGDDNGRPQIDPATGQPAIGQDGKPVMVGAGEKRKRADRIGQHMSWQLTEEQPEWEEDTDKLLHILPIVGCAFRKSYFDPGLGRNASMLVYAENFVVNYWAKSLNTAPRGTEIVKLYPIEIEEKVRAGLFLEQEYGLAPDGEGDDDAPHEFLEQHRRVDLDKDGYAEPYIVTVHKLTGKVCRIVARYDADGVKFSAKNPDRVLRIDAVQHYTKYDFLPAPDGGFYGTGYGQILLPINESVNTTLNMLIDAGHLANTGGGFIGRGLSMHSGTVRFRPGEWKVVNTPGAAIRDAMVELGVRQPSDVLFKLLGLLIEAGKEVASVNEVLTGNQTHANVPATTTLALIEQGLKVFTAVYKRLHRSLKSEYDKLFRLNRLYLEDETSYRRGEEWRQITLEDYQKGAGVEPVSDPTMVSDLQQLARAEALKPFLNDPWMNGHEVRRFVLTALRIPDIDKMLLDQMIQNPQMLTKIEELRIAEIGARARAVGEMARAIHFLAQADATAANTHLTWIQSELGSLEQEIEASGGQQQQGASPPGPPQASPGDQFGLLATLGRAAPLQQ